MPLIDYLRSISRCRIEIRILCPVLWMLACLASTSAAETLPIANDDLRYRLLEPMATAELPRNLPAELQQPGVRFWGYEIGTHDTAALLMATTSDNASVWVDQNRDGELSLTEKHRLNEKHKHSVIDAMDQARSIDSDSTSVIREIPILLRYEPLLDTWMIASLREASGATDFVGKQVDFRIRDENSDGRLEGNEDSLQIDCNADGHFDPIRERFPLARTWMWDERRYAVSLSDDTNSVRVHEINEMGSLTATFDSNSKSIKSPTRVQAVLVSDFGIQVTVSKLNETLQVPVGVYHVHSAVLNWDETPKWRMTFSHLNGEGKNAKVVVGTTTPLAILGDVTLDARVNMGVDANGQRKITLSPQLKTSSGLYLTRASTGHDAATVDVPLLAYAHGKDSAGNAKVIAAGSSEFACGTFCPIPLNLAEHEISSMTLVFDAGPLGGKMTRQLPSAYWKAP